MKLYWLSPFSLADGYGVAATAFVQMLTAAGFDLNLHETWFCVRSELEKKIVDKLLADTSRPVTEKIGIALATPGTFRRLPTPIKVGYTMYESSHPEMRFPGWYKEMAAADALIVPAEYSAKVFSSQFRGPIYVQPIPLLRRYMNAPVKPRFRNNIVKFGIHGTLTERKCPMETIRAFQKAFPRNVEDVRLEVKTRVVLDQSRQMPDFGDPRIRIINETWKPLRLLQWLYTIDCHLFISKGEGFGLPPRESIVTGCPVIVSETSGLLDLKGHAYTVPIKGQSRTHIGGVWDEPDFDAVVDLMRRAYYNREEFSEQGIRAAEWYRREYSWDKLTGSLLIFLGKIDKEFRASPVILHFGHEPTERQDVRDVGSRIRQWAQPRSTILLAGFGTNELGEWFARRAFSVVLVNQSADQKSKYKNLVFSYGSKFELTNIFNESIFELAIIKVEEGELEPGTVRDILDQGFNVADRVVLVFPGGFKERYAVLFEGLENSIFSVNGWQLVRLSRGDSAAKGLLVRNLVEARQRRLGRKGPATLVRGIDGVMVRR